MRLKTISCFAAIGVMSLPLAGCDPASGDLGASGPIKFEDFCSVPGLAPALRQTTIVVDLSAIKPSPPETFRETNPEFLKLAVGLADPARALESGAAAARERITILAGSVKTGALTPVFVGCVPGASKEELGNAQDDATKKYFGSDLKSQISKQQDAFQKKLLMSLVTLSAQSEQATSGEDLRGSPLIKLLRALGPPASADQAVRRVFVFTELGRSLPSLGGDVGEARRRGFEAATEVGLQLGQAELYLVSPGAPPQEAGEQFLSAFMLGSQAELGRVGGFSPNGLAPAPTQVVRYQGLLEATPQIRMPMTLRLASTADGQLVNSWLSYTASHGQRATPVHGEWRCADAADCELRSDPAGGLGQLWRIQPGQAPEVREDAPLGGLRFMEAVDRGGRLKGRIYDPVISIGRLGGAMTLEGQRSGG